jgi:hypothetical protein
MTSIKAAAGQEGHAEERSGKRKAAMTSPDKSTDPTPSSQEHISDYLEGERTLLELKCCAPKKLSALIHDLSRPMNPSLEQALARSLATGEITDFWPAETLMPAMMRRFGLDPATLANDPAIHVLRTTCNTCPKVGTCWLALRHGASEAECRRFCPDAEVFARWAEGKG